MTIKERSEAFLRLHLYIYVAKLLCSENSLRLNSKACLNNLHKKKQKLELRKMRETKKEKDKLLFEIIPESHRTILFVLDVRFAYMHYQYYGSIRKWAEIYLNARKPL